MLRLVAIAAKLWFYKNWMFAGLIAGLFLLAVLPLFAGQWSVAMVAVYLQLPAYMLHQVEEHAGDRFRRYINRNVAGVPDALTTVAVVVVNVPLVWGVDLAAIYLARFVAIGWGLIAVYLMLVNAVVHVVAAVAKRGYNPGLATAVALFLPLSIWGLVAVSAVPGVTIFQHAIGLGLAVVLHAGLAVHVMRRARRLRAAS
jgi:hypothetical protein